MRIVILGGTVFLGRAIARAALDDGHDVTLLHRGIHGRATFPEAEHLIADRTGPLDVLRGRRFDAAIDTSGYAPRDVRRSSQRLAEAGVEHLTFVSSVNAYPAWPAQPVDEESPVWGAADRERATAAEAFDPADYGPAKVAGELAAQEALGADRVAVLRAGMLCGPHDHVFRLAWWVKRIARGGDVLAPGDPLRALQLIDVRDLAAWTLALAGGRTGGVFNATAPIGHVPFGELLETIRSVTGSDARLRWTPEQAILDAGVQPWTELPLWLPQSDGTGTWRVATDRAQAAGLRCRPLGDTVAAVWDWLAAGGEAALPDWQAENRAPGLHPTREAELLAA
jgi:nucleoside-diphosphate-sugar epimerase